MKLLIRLLSLIASVYTIAGCAGSTTCIDTPDGKIVITALTDNSVRVQMAGDLAVPELEELVYTSKVKYSKSRNMLSFYDAEGKVILQESSRSITESQISGVPCYDVTETFESPEDEFIYGTGQFQDGHLNIKGLTDFNPAGTSKADGISTITSA